MNRYRKVEISYRTGSLLVLLSFFFTIVAIRLSYMQICDHRRWSEMAKKQRHATQEIQGARGDILDRHGRPLAVSIEATSVGIQPLKLKNNSKAVSKLASILEHDPLELQEEVKRRSRFFWAARGKDRVCRKKIEALGQTGIVLNSEFRRYYPQGSVAASLLGRVSRNGVGQSGIEHSMDQALRARRNRIVMKRDGRMQRVALATSGQALRDEGDAVRLTIDSMLQSIVEQEIEKGQKTAKAKQIGALIMDADSGELLALAHTGTFDPNRLENVRPTDLRNQLIQDNYEPGSTFKPLVAALAIDKGKLAPQELLNCENGRYSVGRHTIRDVHPQKILPVSEVLVRSSNICMVKIAERLGPKNLEAGLRNFGFGEKTGIAIPGEAKGILRTKWKTIDLATASFGQGLAVTSLQLARAYAALANGGYLVRPQVIVDASSNSAPPRVLKEETARIVSEMLFGVTEKRHGTGKRARIAGLRVAGKTGTAQKAKTRGRGYETDKVLSSFVGFVDTSPIGLDRRLVMVVSVDEPGVVPRWGGVVAAPVFRASMERVVTHLLAHDSEKIRTAKMNNQLKTYS